VTLADARRQNGQRSTTTGRVPPHNLQAEESLIGAMLLSRDAVAVAVETCAPDDFYKPAHGHIFDAICSLYGQGAPVDPTTVSDELGADVLVAVGGAATLITLQANTPATTHADRYAKIVTEFALLRRLIAMAGEISEIGYGVPEDVTVAVDQIREMVDRVTERSEAGTLMCAEDMFTEGLDRLERLYDRGETFSGLSTGFVDLDEKLGGLAKSTLTIIGARPSMGKTAMALAVARHVATLGIPVLFFSLEMSHAEITQRMFSAEARVDSMRIRSGRLSESDWPRISHVMGRLGSVPLYVDDSPTVTVPEMRSRAMRLRSQGGLGLVVVDYLQLMGGRVKAENRQVQLAEISRGLKILARELDEPVIALSQLSRNLEARGDKRPVLSDLRESGSLEQDADVVMFLYRDEVYNPTSDDRGMAEVIISKHRNGPTGVCKLAWLEKYTSFANMSRM
jgi:replicative DNA helicase